MEPQGLKPVVREGMVGVLGKQQIPQDGAVRNDKLKLYGATNK
jgi:hypothetical protein